MNLKKKTVLPTAGGLRGSTQGRRQAAKINQVAAAEAQFQQAIREGQKGCVKTKLALLQQLLQRFQDSDDVAVQYFVAYAMLHQGMTLGDMGQTAAELCLYDDLVQHLARFEPQPVLQSLGMQALMNKAATLAELTQAGAALRLYDEIIQQFYAVEAHDMVIQLAHVMVNKITLLGDLGQWTAQLLAYDQMIQRFLHTEHAPLQQYVAKLMLNKGLALAALGQHEAELASYQALIDWLTPLPNEEMRVYLVKALMNQGATYGVLQQPQAQMAIYHSLIQRFQGQEEGEVAVCVAQTWLNLALTYIGLQQPKEALRTYDQMIARFDDSLGVELQGYLAQAMLNRLLLRHDVHQDKVDGFCAFIERFGDESHERVMACVACAMLNKGIVLGQLGRIEAASATYDRLIALYQHSLVPDVQSCLTQAMMFKERRYGASVKQ